MKKLQIGNVTLENNLILAPMAGVTDLPFRVLCKEMGAAFLKDAALAIVVMADPLASDVWIEDAAIASLMIQLQAEDMGLGSCWIQVRERFTATGIPSGDFVHNVLDIPLQLQVLSIVAVGHKGMERKPFNEENLQWEKIHLGKYGNQ